MSPESPYALGETRLFFVDSKAEALALFAKGTRRGAIFMPSEQKILAAAIAIDETLTRRIVFAKVLFDGALVP